MKINDTYFSADEGDFEKELVGKRIVALTESTVILDDGSVLQIEDGGDCCAWFSGAFRALDLDDNAITRVERVDRGKESEIDWDEHWSLNIYTAHKQIAAVDIDGNPSSGYYGSSINLVVRR